MSYSTRRRFFGGSGQELFGFLQGTKTPIFSITEQAKDVGKIRLMV